MKNPYAFPLAIDFGNDDKHIYDGMTLLDYFAGQALAGIARGLGDSPNYDLVAERAYAQADSMLKEREKMVSDGH